MKFFVFWLLFFCFHINAIPPETLEQARLSVWKLKNESGQGTGATVLKGNRIITNYHVILGLLREGALEDIQLVQNGKVSSVKIKDLKAVSALLDLALLETEGFLSTPLPHNFPPLIEKTEVFVMGYPKGEFRIMKKTGPSRLSHNEENFSINYYSSTLGGLSGGPVLVNVRGELIMSGVVKQASHNSNSITTTHEAALENFLQGNIGTLCRKDDERECLKEEIDSLHRQAIRGDANAQFNLALMYIKGLGVEQSYETAALWYKRAANQGHADAQVNLAFMYIKGLGVEQSYETAALWYERAASQGNAKAQYNLAIMYEDGLGVEQSYETAALWYERAANQGHANAQFNLDLMYEKSLIQNKNN